MGFEAWESFNDNLIPLTWNGHTYIIQEMPTDVGTWLTLKSEAEKACRTVKTPLDKMTDQEQARALLGPAYDQMFADHVPDRMVARATLVAIADWNSGRVAAEAMWTVGPGDPKALAAEIVRRLELTQSTSTAEETTTPEPVSSSGTSTPKGSKPRSPRASKSRSRTSSNNGS